jgi:hypothetical protein
VRGTLRQGLGSLLREGALPHRPGGVLMTHFPHSAGLPAKDKVIIGLIVALLSIRRERPRRRCAAEQRDERAPRQLIELHQMPRAKAWQRIELRGASHLHRTVGAPRRREMVRQRRGLPLALWPARRDQKPTHTPPLCCHAREPC